MNYPVWDVSFGSGLLIAVVSILHVFVSHFAVGGGLFLVLTERKAYRENDPALLSWLMRHTKFFVLATVVFGAVSGVGIWFTIGLVQPSATGSLIHSYVWGWAIEWVFFFVEITAALLYLYGWKRVDRQTHLRLGWIYFAAAFLSMVIINGIITFMLTSGKWVGTFKFWDGFFNPTYFPSLAFRFAWALALAGIYALLTGSVQADTELKSKVVKWSARWIIPAFVVLPFLSFWYISNVPASVWASARGGMPTATRYANLILLFAAVTFVLALLTLVRPRRVPFVLTALVFFSAFGSMWSFEFIREAIRKPYIISDYMYANSVYKRPMPGDAGLALENIQTEGLLKTARWAKYRAITPENQLEVGRDIFRLQCQSCHTVDRYRGITAALQARGWSYSTLLTRLGSLDKMRNGVMPPFAGREEEKEALARFLVSLVPVPKGTTAPEVTQLDGPALFTRYCGDCHEQDPQDPLFSRLHGESEASISYMIAKLDSVNEGMAPFDGSDAEREALAKWLMEQSR